MFVDILSIQFWFRIHSHAYKSQKWICFPHILFYKIRGHALSLKLINYWLQWFEWSGIHDLGHSNVWFPVGGSVWADVEGTAHCIIEISLWEVAQHTRRWRKAHPWSPGLTGVDKSQHWPEDFTNLCRPWSLHIHCHSSCSFRFCPRWHFEQFKEGPEMASLAA